MRIEQPHTLGQQDAVGRIDHLLDRLAEQPPGGVTISDPVKAWNGNQMTFSFTAAKGGFSTSIRGALEVTDDRVIVDADLPVFLKAVLGEARIQQAISSGLASVLGR